jgi:hypothetical protein
MTKDTEDVKLELTTLKPNKEFKIRLRFETELFEIKKDNTLVITDKMKIPDTIPPTPPTPPIVLKAIQR